MKEIALFFSACIILLGCTSTPKVDTVAEAEAIRNLEEQWTAAIQSKDAEKIMSLKAPETVTMVPNAPAVIGLDDNRKRMETSWIDTTLIYESYSSTIDLIEVSASGDLAYVLATDRINKKTPDGIKEEISKIVSIWKKVEGEWKSKVVIWNSNNP